MICERCREEEACDGATVCWDCGAELYDLMRADQDMAAYEEAEALARDGEPHNVSVGITDAF